MSIESSSTVWEGFRADPAGDHYLPESHIVFLPTGTGAANDQYIRKFYQTGAYSHPKKLSVEEKVIHRTVGVSSAVDEVEVKVKFVSGNGGWLLPGIEPHFLEDVVVTFPMVICGSIEQGKIASVRYMWDSAAVLKMARLIGSRNSWPIVAEVQVDALREPTRFRLNPYGDPIGSSGNTQIKSNISSIFNAIPPTEPSPSIRSMLASPGTSTPSVPSTPRKGHPALTSTAFDHLKNAPSPFLEHETDRKLGYMAAHAAAALSSSPPFSSAGFLPSPSSSTATSPLPRNSNNSSGISHKGHPALTSAHFDQPRPMLDQEATASIATSSPPRRGHPALSSKYFDNPAASIDFEDARRPISPQQQPESAALPRAKKGHPALTSQINFGAPPPEPAPRQFRKVKDNIFGHLVEQEGPRLAASPLPSSSAQNQVQQEQQLDHKDEQLFEAQNTSSRQEKPVVSAADAHIYDVEKQVEALKIHDVEAAAPSTPPPEHQHHHEEAHKEIVTATTTARDTPATPPLSTDATTSSASSPLPARKVHPNYRSQITFG